MQVSDMCGIISTELLSKQAVSAACRKAKRKRYTDLFLIETFVQWVNLVFYVMPNIYLLCKAYAFHSPVVYWCGWARWTCWNTVCHHTP